MTAKRVIQTYKPPGEWRQSPPGLGDFVRGACHLFEMLQPIGVELRLDVSRTEFATLIDQDPAVFQAGDATRIGAAEEYFEDHDHQRLRDRVAAFARSDETELYVCTNVGAWNRLALPEPTRRFAAGFYHFTGGVEAINAQALDSRDYAVLSVRCGDEFFDQPDALPPADVLRVITNLVERWVVADARLPVVVTSDCHALKQEFSTRYGMRSLPQRSQHGAHGGAMSVARDLSLLKHSRFNYHINTWADWWSGFSHYTSLIFQIPSMNFRSPRYWKEEVTASGRLVRERWWHALARE